MLKLVNRTCLANQLTGFNRNGTLVINWLRSHPFSKYTKFSEKQTFLYEDGRTYKHKFIGPILLGVKKKKKSDVFRSQSNNYARPLTIFAKSFITDVRLGSKYASDITFT